MSHRKLRGEMNVSMDKMDKDQYMIEPPQDFNDPEEVEEHYKERQVEIRVQPDNKGVFHYKKRTATGGGFFLRMSEMDTPWSMQNVNNSDMFFIALPTGGNVSWKVDGTWSSPPSIFILDNLSIEEAKYSTGTRLDTVVIPAATLHADLASLTGSPCHKRLQFDSDAPLGPDDAATLMHIAAAVKVGLLGESVMNSSPIAASYLRQAMTTVILQGARHNYSNFLRSIPSDVTPARIKRAIEYMYANATKPIRLPEIAEAAALSVRGLQAGFMRHKRLTPMEFLRNVRLERVREDLRNPLVTGSCEQIASRWGFTNFYRFSQAYLTAFGESPRLTFRRHR
ncbi:putative transcriptional regulator, AraC family [Candidatus Paraburkholderia calva]|nr:putative transcriptional regulator, AraC family [Candidatus Paraburkholderia calva]